MKLLCYIVLLAVELGESLVVVMMARSSMVGREKDESRRQARFSQLVRSELSSVIRDGSRTVKTSDKVSPQVLQSTSLVDVEISPDLRSATCVVTTRGDVAAKREAFSWLVRNSKSVRYALARRLSHTKRVPELTFRKADVSKATQLMAFIDDINKDNAAPTVIDGLDLDLDEDDDEEY